MNDPKCVRCGKRGPCKYIHTEDSWVRPFCKSCSKEIEGEEVDMR